MWPLKTDNAQDVDELGPSLTNGSESGKKQFSKILQRWELGAPGLRGLTSISGLSGVRRGFRRQPPPALNQPVPPAARVKPPPDAAKVDRSNTNSEALLIWLKRSSTESETFPVPWRRELQAR